MKLALNSSVNSGVMDSDSRGPATRWRPLMAAGAALAGAGLIAANPVAPAVADLQERAVNLTGLVSQAVDPFAPGVYSFFDVVSESLNQLGITATDWLADPFPILSQVFTNELGYADTTFASLADGFGNLGMFLTGSSAGDLFPSLGALYIDLLQGDFSDAITQWNNIVFGGVEAFGAGLAAGGIFGIPGEIASNLDAVVSTLLGDGPAGLASIVGGGLGSFEAGFLQAGAAADAASTAFADGQVFQGLLDVTQIPSSYMYGLLDGIVNGSFGQAGWLTAIDGFGGTEPVAGGLLASLLVYLPQQIAIDLGADLPKMAAEHAVNIGSLAADLLGAL